MNKPKKYQPVPLGAYPEWLYNNIIKQEIDLNGGLDERQILKDRINTLSGAIKRYIEAGLHIDIKWVEEYNTKIINLKNYNYE